jgi:hypothetical protein
MNSLTLQANAGGCGGVAIAEPFVRLVDKLKLSCYLANFSRKPGSDPVHQELRTRLRSGQPNSRWPQRASLGITRVVAIRLIAIADRIADWRQSR